MSELWNTSALSQVDKVTFNWKIENFPSVLRIFGVNGFESHEFKVTSSDGMVHALKLKFTKSPIETTSLKVNGADVIHPWNYSLINFEVVFSSSKKEKVYLAGKLEFDLQGRKVMGIFGNADAVEFVFNSRWVLTNRTDKSVYTTNANHSDTNHSTTGFFISNYISTLVMKLRLVTPGVVNNTISLVPSEKAVKEIGASRLASDIKSLLTNAEEYSDFTISCEDDIFHCHIHCHETILRMRSPVFARMFEQKMSESTNRVLSICDVKEDTVEALLEYIYTGEITMKVENESELLYIADKYEIAGLLELCFHKLPEVELDMVVDILIMADRHKLEDFKKVAMQRIQMNKAKFRSDDNFVNKMKQIPHLLVEFFQQFN